MLRAPFPWFGGKSRAAHLVWPRFGDVSNYIEPFFGGGAVLLNRPPQFPPRVETANDIDGYLANFWRAVRSDPWQVAEYADWPVNEVDLHARHRWLVTTGRERIDRLKRDPDFFDAKVAGWWVYGQCLWIGSGWCATPEWTGRVNAARWNRGVHTDRYLSTRGMKPDDYEQRPDLSSSNGRGAAINTRNGDTSEQERRPQLTFDQGINRQETWHTGRDTSEQARRPELKADKGINSLGVGGWVKRPEMKRGGGRGVHSREIQDDPVEKPVSGRRPNMGGAGGGQGVHAPRLTKEQVPDLSGSRGAVGRGVHASALVRAEGLFNYMHALAKRLRRVRVCSGDWSRVVTPAVTYYIGLTGILLDPPYSHDERSICYSHDNDIAHEVRKWALENGDNPKLRLALCGYEGEHEMPDSWECVTWKAGGGYGRSERGKANRYRERIWFSPHCLRPASGLPFDELEVEPDGEEEEVDGTAAAE